MIGRWLGALLRLLLGPILELRRRAAAAAAAAAARAEEAVDRAVEARARVIQDAYLRGATDALAALDRQNPALFVALSVPTNDPHGLLCLLREQPAGRALAVCVCGWKKLDGSAKGATDEHQRHASRAFDADLPPGPGPRRARPRGSP